MADQKGISQQCQLCILVSVGIPGIALAFRANSSVERLESSICLIPSIFSFEHDCTKSCDV